MIPEGLGVNYHILALINCEIVLSWGVLMEKLSGCKPNIWEFSHILRLAIVMMSVFYTITQITQKPIEILVYTASQVNGGFPVETEKEGNGILPCFPSKLTAGNEGFPSKLKAGNEGFPSKLKAGNEGFPSKLKAGNEGFPSKLKAGNEGFPSKAEYFPSEAIH